MNVPLDQLLEMAALTDPGRVRPGNEDAVHADPELGLVIVYAAVFTVVEFAYYFWVKRKNRKLKSTLIQFDNVSWLVDAMLSVGLLISFVTALVLKHQGYAQWAAYVDPAILILLLAMVIFRKHNAIL